MKYAQKYGYSIKIEYSYLFEKEQNLFTDYVKDHFEIKKTSKLVIKISTAKLFLNALYGRMGTKEIENILKIVNKEQADQINKNSNISWFSEIGKDKVIVRYKGQVSENIRKLYKDADIDFTLNKTYNKKQIKDIGLLKKTGVPSAVHIAAAIASYARISINEYKNIQGNQCIISDTDSAVLQYPLPDHLVGREFGQMKLVNEIKRGIFIRKKLYSILDKNDQEIIKSSGVDSTKLNYNSFLSLLNGESVIVPRISFKINWKDLSLIVIQSNITIKGLSGKLKTLNNIKGTDINNKKKIFNKYRNILKYKFYIINVIFILTNNI